VTWNGDDCYRKAVEDEHGDHRRQHEKGDGRVAHGERGVRPRTPGYVCTDEPGPSGIPIRYQATKNRIQAIVRMTT
jgi:hypothetical protein